LTDDRAFGADDVAGALYTGKRLRKLRFLMTDNKRKTPKRKNGIQRPPERRDARQQYAFHH